MVTSQVVSRVPLSQVKAARAGVGSSTMQAAAAREASRVRWVKRAWLRGECVMRQPSIRIATEPCSVWKKDWVDRPGPEPATGSSNRKAM